MKPKTTMEEQWHEFRRVAIAQMVSPAELENTRLVFMGGFVAAINCTNDMMINSTQDEIEATLQKFAAETRVLMADLARINRGRSH